MTKKRPSKSRKLFVGSASSEQSQVAELTASNVDLLTEILLSLPAKSLLRFEGVSKHWLTLISDYRFASDHACQSSNSSVSGIYWKFRLEKGVKSVSLHGRSSLPTLSFLDHLEEVSGGSNFIIHKSCNGLMWCSHGFGRPYIVSNLNTQKFIIVPYPGSSVSYNSYLDVCLAFDRSKSPDFKVVVASHSYQILICSSRSASWKTLFFPSSRCYPIVHKVFCKGAIHWMCTENIHCRFELDEEELIQTPFPREPKILDSKNTQYFEECCGHSLLIQIREFSAEGFRILVRNRVNLRPFIALLSKTVHNKSWNYSRYRDKIWKFSVLCAVKEANIEDCSL